MSAGRASARRPLSLPEAACVLESSYATIRSRIRRGELEVCWTGRRRGIPVEVVEDLVRHDALALEVLDAIIAGRLCVRAADIPAFDQLVALLAGAGSGGYAHVAARSQASS